MGVGVGGGGGGGSVLIIDVKVKKILEQLNEVEKVLFFWLVYWMIDDLMH